VHTKFFTFFDESWIDTICIYIEEIVSTVVSILIFLGQSVVVCQSYNGGLWSPPQQRSPD